MRNPTNWKPPADLIASVNPEEFKFCFELMNAAYSGQMPTRNPAQLGISIRDENSDAVTGYVLADIPMNRAMLAVREHFRETRSEEKQCEFQAMSFRLLCFGDFIRGCSKSRDARLTPFVQITDGYLSGIDDALIEAAAVVTVRKNGFAHKEMFIKATELQKQANIPSK